MDQQVPHGVDIPGARWGSISVIGVATWYLVFAGRRPVCKGRSCRCDCTRRSLLDCPQSMHVIVRLIVQSQPANIVDFGRGLVKVVHKDAILRRPHEGLGRLSIGRDA